MNVQLLLNGYANNTLDINHVRIVLQTVQTNKNIVAQNFSINQFY